MRYGYLNAYITDVDEDVAGEIKMIREHVDDLKVDVLSYRPILNELIDMVLKEGDCLYIYSFRRFCSGLTDLDCLLTEIYDEMHVDVVSIADDFDTRTPEGKGFRRGIEQAVRLCASDPNYGLYK